jgi:hypothetical protein
MMVGYAFHVGLFHSLLFAGFYRRFLNVPELPIHEDYRAFVPTESD